MTPTELLERLVSFDTTSRYSNLPLIAFIEDYLASHGVACHRVADPDQPKANLHAVIGPLVEGGIALSGHVDCVPVEDQPWHGNPFVLRREKDRLIGRGTTDMKGYVACMLAMVPELVAAKLARPVHLCITFDEEITCGGAKLLVEHLNTAPGPRPALCYIGEATGMAPVIAHKGYSGFDLRFFGLGGHSSRTDRTANAVQAAAEAVAWLAGEARRIAGEGPFLEGFEPPYTTVHVGSIAGGAPDTLNIVPAEAHFAMEIRCLPGESAEGIVARLRDFVEGTVLAEQRLRFSDARWEIRPRAEVPPLGCPEDHPLTLLTQALTGHNTAGKVSYATEAGIFEQGGIPAIICGPGDIARAHLAEEWITEAELASCITFMRRLAATLQR